MKKEDLFVLGLGGSVLVSILWKLWSGSETLKVNRYKITADGEPQLSFLQQYHLGLACLIGGRIFPGQSQILDGVGAGLVASEALAEHPFGVGESRYQMQCNLILGSALTGALSVVSATD